MAKSKVVQRFKNNLQTWHNRPDNNKIKCINNHRAKMYYYVYILRSINYPKKTYIGFTSNLKNRIKTHNEGGSPHTSKYKPWQIENAISFNDKSKALRFEKYLKSHSGRAFVSKHF